MITPEEFSYIRSIFIYDCFTSKDIDIELHTYKPFSHLILTGKNGSGKTTIVSAIGNQLSPAGGYLDPCHPNDDVERDIVYSVEVGGAVFVHPRDDTNVKAVNTAALLNKVHLELSEPIRLKHHAVVYAVAR